MADYIKREDVEAVVSHFIHSGAFSVADFIYAFGKIPSADVVERKKGKWNRTDAYPHRIYCSVCYKTYLKNEELLERWEFPLNYCPNCGAEMEGE